MAQYDLNLRDYWRILRKRKWSVALITLAFGGLAFLFAQAEKPSPLFQATAVVKFERATTLVGLMVEVIRSIRESKSAADPPNWPHGSPNCWPNCARTGPITRNPAAA